MSFADIMREQTVQSSRASTYDRDSEESFKRKMEIALALSSSAGENSPSAPTNDADPVAALSDYELALKLSMEEQQAIEKEEKKRLPEAEDQSQFLSDIEIARHLQKEERQRLQREDIGQTSAHKFKYLSSLEQEVSRAKLDAEYGYDEAYEYVDEEEEEKEDREYDYTEICKGNADDVPLLYDPAQREEDKEIVGVSKRIPEKRVNAHHTALHHKRIYNRSKGKTAKNELGLVQPKLAKNSSKVKKAKNELGFIEDYLRPTVDSHFVYGIIAEIPGRHVKVDCMDQKSRLCNRIGTAKKSNFGREGTPVIVRLREYQAHRGEICHVIRSKQWNILTESNPELKAFTETLDYDIKA